MKGPQSHQTSMQQDESSKEHCDMPFTRQEDLGSRSLSQSQLYGVRGPVVDGARNRDRMLSRDNQSTIEQAQEGRNYDNLADQAADMAGSRGSLMREVHGVQVTQREPAEDAYNRYAKMHNREHQVNELGQGVGQPADMFTLN